MVADAMFVLSLHTNAESIAVGAEISCLRDGRANARECVVICHFVGINGPMVNLFRYSIKHTSIDAVAREIAERFSMIKHFACSIEVLFDLRPLRQVLHVIDRNAFMVRVGSEELLYITAFLLLHVSWGEFRRRALGNVGGSESPDVVRRFGMYADQFNDGKRLENCEIECVEIGFEGALKIDFRGVGYVFPAIFVPIRDEL